MRKRWTVIFIIFLFSANVIQFGDRYLLTKKLERMYQAQHNFEDASDIVIKMYQKRVEQLYHEKCGEVLE